MMEGSDDLREQAKQWRRIAERYTPGLARALREAAAALDARADWIESTSEAPPPQPRAPTRPDNG